MVPEKWVQGGYGRRLGTVGRYVVVITLSVAVAL